MIIVDSCMIWFHFDCIMQLEKSYHIATNVCNRKCATTFGDLPDLWVNQQLPAFLVVTGFHSDSLWCCIFHMLTLVMLNLFLETLSEIYMYFLSLTTTEMVQVVEMFPGEKHRPVYAVYSIPLLLMAWQHRKPGHQQPWYLKLSSFSSSRVNMQHVMMILILSGLVTDTLKAMLDKHAMGPYKTVTSLRMIQICWEGRWCLPHRKCVCLIQCVP